MKTPPNQVEALDPVDPEAFKRFLGPAAGAYTEAQLLQLSREMHAMAELLLDIYEQHKPPDRSPKAL